MGAHGVAVARDDDVLGAERLIRRFLVRRRGENGYPGAERLGELHAQVAESAQPYDAGTLAVRDLPVRECFPDRDAGAHQGCRRGRVQGWGQG